MNTLLENKTIRLLPLSRTDIPDLLNFFGDMEAMRFYLPNMWRTYNLEQLYGLLDDWHDQVTDFVYSIKTCDSKEELLGIVNVSNIDWSARTGEVGLAIVNQRQRGKGLGSMALTLMLDYAFGQMGLRRIYAHVIDGNEPSLRMFDKMGFKREGLLREHVIRGGHPHDMILYGLLKDEWPMVE